MSQPTPPGPLTQPGPRPQPQPSSPPVYLPPRRGQFGRIAIIIAVVGAFWVAGSDSYGIKHEYVGTREPN
jgi:hypothetical protein